MFLFTMQRMREDLASSTQFFAIPRREGRALYNGGQLNVEERIVENTQCQEVACTPTRLSTIVSGDAGRVRPETRLPSKQ